MIYRRSIYSKTASDKGKTWLVFEMCLMFLIRVQYICEMFAIHLSQTSHKHLSHILITTAILDKSHQLFAIHLLLLITICAFAICACVTNQDPRYQGQLSAREERRNWHAKRVKEWRLRRWWMPSTSQ